MGHICFDIVISTSFLTALDYKTPIFIHSLLQNFTPFDSEKSVTEIFDHIKFILMLLSGCTQRGWTTHFLAGPFGKKDVTCHNAAHLMLRYRLFVWTQGFVMIIYYKFNYLQAEIIILGNLFAKTGRWMDRGHL